MATAIDDIFYIYILYRPDYPDPFYVWKDQPFYVGKGCNGRIAQHRQEANRFLTNHKKKNIKIKIIHKLWKNNLDFKEVILFDNLTEQEAFEIEIELIAFYGRIDLGTGCLANLTDGGEGLSGWVPTKEYKQKMSEICTGLQVGENNPMYGRKHTEETKRKMRDNSLHISGEKHHLYGKKHSEETKEKRSKSRIGFKHTEESKRKIGKASKGRKHTEETKQKMRDSRKGKVLSEEHKQKIGLSISGEKNGFYGKHHTEESIQKFVGTKLKKKRQKALEICGHEDWLKCQYCKIYDDPKNLCISGTRVLHVICRRKYNNERNRNISRNRN